MLLLTDELKNQVVKLYKDLEFLLRFLLDLHINLGKIKHLTLLSHLIWEHKLFFTYSDLHSSTLIKINNFRYISPEHFCQF